MPDGSSGGRGADEEQHLAAVIEASPAIIYVKDRQGRYRLVNPPLERLAQRPRERIYGVTDEDLFAPEIARQFRSSDRRVAESGAPLELEETVGLPDGHRTFLSVKFPIFGPGGELQGIGGISTEITLVRHTEAELRQLQQNFDLFLENVSGYAIYLLDPSGRVASWNSGAERMTGYTAAEMLGQDASSIYPKEDRQKGIPQMLLREARETGRVEVEGWRIRKDGSRFWADAVTTALRERDGSLRGYAKILHDITERKRAEEDLRDARNALESRVRRRTAELAQANTRLQQSEEYFRALTENALDIVTVLQDDGSIRYQSPALERLLGYSFEEVAAHNVFDFVHPEDVKRVRTLVASRAEVPGATGSVEFRFRHKNGGWRVLEACGKNLLDDPAVQGIVINSRDITERKLAEDQMRSLAARLVHAEEAERRRISRELHDDLNQQLASLVVDLGMLGRKSNDPVSPLAGQVHSLQARIVSLSDTVRRMAHQLHPSVLDDLGLAAALRGYCHDLAAREGIRIEFRARSLPPAIPPELASALYRIAQEALWNAVKHAGSKSISVTLVRHRERIHMQVRDFGVGFDPQAARGKGLGLLSIQERAQVVGGRAVVRSKPGDGTRIEVDVPLQGAKP